MSMAKRTAKSCISWLKEYQVSHLDYMVSKVPSNVIDSVTHPFPSEVVLPATLTRGKIANLQCGRKFSSQIVLNLDYSLVFYYCCSFLFIRTNTFHKVFPLRYLEISMLLDPRCKLGGGVQFWWVLFFKCLKELVSLKVNGQPCKLQLNSRLDPFLITN